MTDKSKWLARLSDTTTIIQVDDIKFELSYDHYRIHAVRTWTDKPPQQTKRVQEIQNILNTPTTGGIIIQDVKHFKQAINQARAFARHNAEAVYLEYHPAQHTLTVRSRNTEYGNVDIGIPAHPIGAARFVQVLINARYLQDALLEIKQGSLELYVTNKAVFIWGDKIHFAAIAIMIDEFKPPVPIITNEPAPVPQKPIRPKTSRLYRQKKSTISQPVPDYIKPVELIVYRVKSPYRRGKDYVVCLSIVG
ncbi:MAG: hypothetical protein D6712_04715 [Chloroflexi bacterium]|nr:MAG: hypothetical protein D6712_04715 [Chloroflexota bacterium]